ncbi:hypothetical protein BH24PSE2_BH24PSE2_21930 [soil metagenome]
MATSQSTSAIQAPPSDRVSLALSRARSLLEFATADQMDYSQFDNDQIMALLFAVADCIDSAQDAATDLADPARSDRTSDTVI